jgi:enoyl-[acyl-carrier protein] reductase I
MEASINPVLAGRKALIVGVANNQSIAYGCAKAFRAAGADLAITWLNEKARPHVELLAHELGDYGGAGRLEARRIRNVV